MSVTSQCVERLKPSRVSITFILNITHLLPADRTPYSSKDIRSDFPSKLFFSSKIELSPYSYVLVCVENSSYFRKKRLIAAVRRWVSVKMGDERDLPQIQ